MCRKCLKFGQDNKKVKNTRRKCIKDNTIDRFFTFFYATYFIPYINGRHFPTRSQLSESTLIPCIARRAGAVSDNKGKGQKYWRQDNRTGTESILNRIKVLTLT